MARERTLQPPVEVVRRELATWDVPHVARAVFGTEDAEQIVAMADRFCAEHLGSGVAGYYFATASVGATHGLRLLDGRDVVLKGVGLNKRKSSHRPLVARAVMQRSLPPGL
jgi:hypothetical protein